MHNTISYKGLPKDEADRKAVADIREFLQPAQWEALQMLVNNLKCDCELIDAALHMTGISGYPVFAFIRLMRPNEYQDWFNSRPD